MPSKKGIGITTMNRFRSVWNIWAKALGPKSNPEDDKASDQVAIIRTIILLIYVVTNFFIVAGILKHWND